jgi:hypothetical protein
MSEQQFEELNSSELAELARKKFGRREGSLNRTSLLKILSGEKIAPTKEERIGLVLEKMTGLPQEKRGAEFRICAAVYNPHEGTYLIANGVERGVLLEAPANGAEGFGYDPIFLVPEYGKTLSELGPTMKNSMSHRYLALQAIRPTLLQLRDGILAHLKQKNKIELKLN